MVTQLPATLHPLLSLHPGDWYFGSAYEKLHTVLGSCVALTAWHAGYRVGGMCHYLLPLAPAKKSAKVGDCRYANYALTQMKASMQAYAPLHDFQISLFGGGDMFSYNTPRSIGRDNIAYARQWLAKEKIQLSKADVGGAISRSLSLMLGSGEIQLKRYAMHPLQTL